MYARFHLQQGFWLYSKTLEISYQQHTMNTGALPLIRRVRDVFVMYELRILIMMYILVTFNWF